MVSNYELKNNMLILKGQLLERMKLPNSGNIRQN